MRLFFNSACIEMHFDKADIDGIHKASMIPYVHKNRSGTIFKTSIRNIDVVLKIFRNVDYNNIHTAPPNIQRLYTKEMQRRIDLKSLIDLGPQRTSPWLKPHQQLGVEIAESVDRFAFFYDTRTGKTPMSLQIIYDDVSKHPDHKWLVLCPLVLIENAWMEDAAKFFPDLNIVSLHATKKADRMQRFNTKVNVYVQNIESFCNYRENIDKLGIHGVFVDESSTMKSNKAKFTKEAIDFSKTVTKWYLLSGTPAPNGEYEYYSQLLSVDYYAFQQSYTQFKTYFFNNLSYNPQYEKLAIKQERSKEFMGHVKEYALYVDKEDVLDTPGRTFSVVDLQLPKDLKAHYDTMRKELYIEISSGDNKELITATSAAAKLNKLNQVSSGFVINTETKENKLLDIYRFNRLLELLREIGDKQVLIWANYKAEFETIKQLLGNECRCIYGDTSIEEKNQHIKEFKQGKFKYLVANPRSADKGLTLTNAYHCIYFSLNYSYELWKQSIERIYGDKRSQPNHCYYYIFIAKNTVDEALYTVLNTKGDLATAMLDHLKGGIQHD